MNADLQQLKDIHLPLAISKWPVAPGWIALMGLIILIVTCIFYFRIRARRKYTIKFAFAQLKKLQSLLNDNPQNINIAAEISTLLRRTALYYYQRQEIAGLTGKDWLNFLNQSGNTKQFTEEIGYLLTDAPYQKDNSKDILPLFALTKTWLVSIAKKKVIVLEK